MSAPQILSVPVQVEDDPLDLVQSTIIGALTALDEVDGVTFGGLAGAPGPAVRRYEATIVAGSQTVKVTITSERTA